MSNDLDIYICWMNGYFLLFQKYTVGFSLTQGLKTTTIDYTLLFFIMLCSLSWTYFTISEGGHMYVVSILENSACGWCVLCLSELTNVLFNSVVVRVAQCVCVCVQHTLLCWWLFKLTLSLQFNIIVRTMQVRLSFLLSLITKLWPQSPLLPSLVNP